MTNLNKRPPVRRKSTLSRFASTAGLAALVGGGVLGLMVVAVVLALVFAVPGAWILMLLVGALHSLVPSVPALGFWVCYLIFFIVRLLFGNNHTTTTTTR